MMTQDEVDAIAERVREPEPKLEADEAPKPKRRTRKRRTATRTRTRTPSDKPPSLRQPLKAMFETVGSVWHMSELTRGHVPLAEDYPTCGSVLVAQADDMATTLNLLAQSDPNVYRWLDRMMSGGGWGGVVLATWPVAQAVLQSHVMPALNRRREVTDFEASLDSPGFPIETEGNEGGGWPPEPTP